MSSESKTTLYLIFCSLEKAYFFQTLVILVQVQLGRCTRCQIWVSAKGLCVNTHKPSCDNKLLFATLVC